jgi:hypothetical protein
VNVAGRENSACGDYEFLMSKACDGECTPNEVTELGEHLKICAQCRDMMDDYREIRTRMASYVISMSCPPPPQIAPKWRERAAGILSRLGVRRYVPTIVGVSVCILFFALGFLSGSNHMEVKFARIMPSIIVATPSLWMADRTPGSVSVTSIESEQPFTDGISRYRAAIADELRKDSVDWLKVRELVESMGELRTNLELLTIHMAYIDIRTGSLPSTVANHWESLGSKNERKALMR